MLCILDAYDSTRRQTERLIEPLSAEDCCVQSMEDVSPAKWHLAHTTWFFETFLLDPLIDDYEPFNPRFAYLFNSYYDAAGPRHARPKRGLLTRPSLEEVRAYRRQVDRHMGELLASPPPGKDREVGVRTRLGLMHEEQHQELLLMDIKHVFASNPLAPAYMATAPSMSYPAPGRPTEWIEFDAEVSSIGHGPDGIAYDNERPRHRVFLEPYALADRPVRNADYLMFIEDGGYDTPRWWLSDGWTYIQDRAVRAPLYWRQNGAGYQELTLHGPAAIDPEAPVTHVSYYEADAYARWANARLPTEAEWEHAAGTRDQNHGHFANRLPLHPEPSDSSTGLRQLYGDVWEWTSSAYLPYPGFRPLQGALGEYNGKFMVGQHVLRGGACVTPPGHVRPTYRNYFYPHHRWVFSGFRLARSLN